MSLGCCLDIQELTDLTQVCIDQNDELEKGHQVRMMARIYRASTHTVVWLGKEDNKRRLAMESFRAIYESKHFSKVSAIGFSDDCEDDVHRPQRLELSLNALLRDFPLDRLTAALPDFMHWEWWSRLWVVPEVALAK